MKTPALWNAIQGSFNLPDESRKKGKADIEEMGIKTFFCSDVCAAYRVDLFHKLGGFESPVIFNEDMFFAAKAVFAGYYVKYEAEAKVIHSHNYTVRQQFHRNFDLAVSQTCIRRSLSRSVQKRRE